MGLSHKLGKQQSNTETEREENQWLEKYLFRFTLAKKKVTLFFSNRILPDSIVL